MAFNALINRCSQVALDVNLGQIGQNGTPLQQWDYQGTPNQHWEFQDAGGGWVWLKNQQSGKALDVVAGQIGNNAAAVQQWDYQGTPNQQWQKVNTGSGWFWLQNRQSGKALDVHVYDIAKNGARVQQFDFLGNTNQQWKEGGNTGSDRFTFGSFTFALTISSDQVCKLFERHRFAFSRIGSCGNLNAGEQQALRTAYARAIDHDVSTNPNANAEAFVNGSQILVNFGNLFPQGDNEIAQSLIHEMMHCAGYTHPDKTGQDQPNDNGSYYGSPPLRAEICIAGNQSDVVKALTLKARYESCSSVGGRCVIRIND
jgi:hypothetical protein